MSILDTLKSWEHTFTGWVAKQYASFRKIEPTVVNLGDRVFPYAKTAIDIALSFESPEVIAVANPILDKLHSSFDVAASLLYDFGPHPNVVNALTTAQNNLSSFEQLAGIKSDGAKNAIAKALSSVQAFVASVISAANAAKPPAVIDPPNPTVPVA